MSDGPATESIARARLTVGCGPLARALAGRLLMSLGAETDLPLDRVQEAAILAETIVDGCRGLTPDETVELAVRADAGRLELRAGPFAPGGAQRLLAADGRTVVGGVLRRLASGTTVRQGRDGTETLVLTVLAHAGPAPPSAS